MILQLFALSPMLALGAIAIVVLALTLHELGHAWVADINGDSLPRQQGRLTLNPIAHIDWIGFALILLIGFGWAKPVLTRPGQFKYRWSDFSVSIAGVVANLLLAVIGLLVFRWSDPSGVWESLTYLLVSLNCSLIVVNLIPLPPLDGAHILASVLPERMAGPLQQSNASSQWMGIVAIVVLGQLGIIGQVAAALQGFLSTWILGHPL